MATQFRQLGTEDAEPLARRLLTWHRQPGGRLDPALVRQESRRLLADNERWHAWMIVHRDEEVGYLMLQFRRGGMFEAPRAYVAALYLVPEVRGRGIGALAHRFVADLGRWLQVRLFEFDTADEAKPVRWMVRTAPPSAAPDTSFLQATA